MATLILALLLAAVLAFFVPSLQKALQIQLHARPLLIWLAPPALALVFAGAAAMAGAFSLPLTGLVFAYACAPVLCVFVAGAGFVKRPGAADFLAILLLWLPLEFAAGQTLVPRPAQGFLHSVGYGIAILLGLLLFIGFRSFPGLKYNLPRGVASPRRRGDAEKKPEGSELAEASESRAWLSEIWLPLAAFALTAPVLVLIGIPIGFIPPPHLPVQSAGRMAGALGIIFVGTALPEEILFRSLIQNLLMLRFGRGIGVLIAASVIFGCAHLDNGPQPVPNWRYAILATVAGFAYGKVFEKGSTVLSSATLHCLVDWTKHFFF